MVRDLYRAPRQDDVARKRRDNVGAFRRIGHGQTFGWLAIIAESGNRSKP